MSQVIDRFSTVRVYNPSTREILLEKEVSSKEEIKKIPLDAKPRQVSTLESWVVVARIDNMKVFLRDLFFPVFSEQWSIEKKTWSQRFVCLFVGIIDLSTVGIRLITLLFRYLFDSSYYSKKQHPFYQYLIDNKVDERKLNIEKVQVSIEEIQDTYNSQQDKEKNKKSARHVETKEKTVHFMFYQKDSTIRESEFGSDTKFIPEVIPTTEI